MVQYWEPGTQYNNGDVVEYNGQKYKIIQPHRSQGDWTPDNTPALWGRTSDQGHSSYNQGNNQSNNQYQQNQGYQPQQQPVQQPHQQDHKTEQHGEENKHWYDDPDKRKKVGVGAGIGAGVIAGATLLAGAGLIAGGVHAYKSHKEHEREDEMDRGEMESNTYRKY